MRRETLVDFFHDLSRLDAPFLTYDDGFRTWNYSYREAADAARSFAARLNAHGISKGDKIILWSENRPEWIAALWGSILAGAIVVPLDYRASSSFLERVVSIVKAKVIVAGDDVEVPPQAGGVAAVWPI